MLKVKTPFKSSVLMMVLILYPVFLMGQAVTDNSSKLSIEVSVPESVETEAVFEIGFKIWKDAGYVGNFRLVFDFPKGFEVLEPSDDQVVLTFDGQKYSLFSDILPAGENYMLNLSVRTGDLQKAVYPLRGTVFMENLQQGFSTRISLVKPKSAVSAVSTIKPDASVKATFTLPDLIRSDDVFDFVTSIQKPFDYNKAGQLRQKFTAGFDPQPTNIAGCDFEVENNEVVISWQTMDFGEEINISYAVKAGQIPGGVYPILTSYSDESGFMFEKVSFLTLTNFNKPDLPEAKNTEVSIYKLSLAYPDEIVADQKFEVTASIQKGKNVGPGILEINLPSGFAIEPQDELNYKYDPLSGNWQVAWNAMPASPVFEKKMSFSLENIRNAIYPVSAWFSIDSNVVAYYFNNINVVDKKAPDQSLEKIAETPVNSIEIDTTTIFAKIDDLLNQWKVATNSPTNQVEENVENTSENMSSVPTQEIQVQPENASEPAVITQKAVSSEYHPEIVFNYGIQILASKVPMTEVLGSLSALGIDEVSYENYDGIYYRYVVGKFDTLKAAKDYLIFVKEKGYSDAFVAEFINGKRGRIY
jgi:hypothetical protein